MTTIGRGLVDPPRLVNPESLLPSGVSQVPDSTSSANAASKMRQSLQVTTYEKNEQRCFFCHRVATSHRGHVIPRFVSKYIKQSSAKTHHARLRQGHDGHFVQDGPTHRMFCRACEQLLSHDEQSFSRYAFGVPYALADEAIAYDEWLLRFATSVMLRVCVANLYFSGDDDTVAPLSARHRTLLEGACRDFREYLLGVSDWPGKLRPLRVSVGLTEVPHDRVMRSLWDFYMTRGFDSSIVVGNDLLAIYAHVPFHVFWTGVAPKKVRGQRLEELSNQETRRDRSECRTANARCLLGILGLAATGRGSWVRGSSPITIGLDLPHGPAVAPEVPGE